MSGKDENASREDIHSKVVRAGKRTYFFDVKSTRGNDLYLTITESKRHYSDEGKIRYEKHKLFIYKEDFEKFADGLNETIGKIEELRNEEGSIFAEPIIGHANHETGENAEKNSSESSSENGVVQEEINSEPDIDNNKFTSVDFDDLGSKEKQ